MIFDRKRKRRVEMLEDTLHRISELAHMAVMEGYSPKGSPAEHRFDCIAAVADEGLELKGGNDRE